MKTKKISELTMMETVSDAANVLVEENGEAKRVPAGKILPEHLQFGETVVMGDTLTWDGNTEGLTCVDGAFFKMSDAVPTMEDLANGASIVISNGTNSVELDLSYEDIVDYGDGLISISAYVFVVQEKALGVEMDGLLFNETGVYFAYVPEELTVHSLTIPGYTGFVTKTVKPIDKKYLPADVVGSTRFYVHIDSHTIYVDPVNEVEATSADVDAALDKGPVYFEDMLNQHITSMFQIELGNNAGYYIRLFHSIGGNFSEKYVTTSDFEMAPE